MRIALISLYPDQNSKHTNTSGVASYTYNLVHSYELGNNKLIVICNKTDKSESKYKDGDIEVCRDFSRNLLFLPQLLKSIFKIKPDVIHIQHELHLYGGIINAAALSIGYLLTTFIPKITTLHGVVSIKMINQEFVKENNSSLPPFVVKLAFKILMKPIIFLSRKVIVHEEKFKNILIDEYGSDPNKIEVIYHGVEDLKKDDQINSKNTLGIDPKHKVILFLGYLTGYKGIDLLIDAFKKYHEEFNSQSILLVCAGKHPKLQNDQLYLENSYNKTKQHAQEELGNSHKWIGFVKEEDLKLYYSASDLVVFPYTISMSSSGPMALSIGYEVPFIASDAFKGIFPETMLFERTNDALAEKIHDSITNNENYSNQLISLRDQRLWSYVGKQHTDLYLSLK